MKFFIGIVPPAEIYNTVAEIQKKFGDNRLEPHITLRPPVTVIEETGWLKEIEKVCAGFSPFNIHLPSTGFFDKRVLFIDVVSDDLSRLHYSIVEAIKRYEQPEGNNGHEKKYRPHLTLGRSWCGFSMQDFKEMKKLADDFLSLHSVSFSANTVRVYHKPSGAGRYAVREDVFLGGLLNQ